MTVSGSSNEHGGDVLAHQTAAQRDLLLGVRRTGRWRGWFETRALRSSMAATWRTRASIASTRHAAVLQRERQILVATVIVS